jgi:adenylate cyclase
MRHDGTQSKISHWLVDPETRSLSLEALLDALSGWLDEAGCSLLRVQLSFRTLHPEVAARAYRWLRGEKTREILFTYHFIASSGEEHEQSPIFALMREKKSVIRCSLEQPDSEIPFPLCREMKTQGGTDYYLMRLSGSNGFDSSISFVTDRKGGFGEDEIELFQSLVPSLSLRIELAAAYYANDSLLRTYLWHNASRRVREGMVRRGAGERIRAAIWMCDLRGFTAFVDRTTLEEVIETLDAYFECVADAVVEHGGEVLKFIGDAVLGIFPMDEGAQSACARALSAAEEAFARRDRLAMARREAGKSSIQFGIALHIGEVMYGNIGATGRLDFTVIGAAVNETSRLESLCKELGTNLILSESFVETGEVVQAVSLGRRALRGVSHDVELFTLPEHTLTQPTMPTERGG